VSALTWTTTPPDRPGWWWMRRGSGPLAYCLPMQVLSLNGHMQVHLPGNPYSPTLGDLVIVEHMQDVSWAGPIEEPTEASV